MDGAIVLDRDASRILPGRGAPDARPRASPPTRPAPGTAPPTGSPGRPDSRSSRCRSRCRSSPCTSGDIRYVLEDSGQILSRANQALATLERYKTPPRRGLQHAVRAGDRGPGHRARRRRGRAAAGDGHPDRARDRGLRARARHRRPAAVAAARGAGHRRRERAAARVRDYLQRAPASYDRGGALQPGPPVADRAGRRRRRRRPRWDSAPPSRWTRRRPARATGCWPRCPRLPGLVADRLVEHFGSLQKLLSATAEDLQMVDGVGELRARSVREGLSRLAESSFLERYV